jgi:adenylate cyclase
MLTLAQELSHPSSLAYALHGGAIVHQFRRERQTVQEWAEAVIALSGEKELPYFLAIGTIFRGWALERVMHFAPSASQRV